MTNFVGMFLLQFRSVNVLFHIKGLKGLHETEYISRSSGTLSFFNQKTSTSRFVVNNPFVLIIKFQWLLTSQPSQSHGLHGYTVIISFCCFFTESLVLLSDRPHQTAADDGSHCSALELCCELEDNSNQNLQQIAALCKAKNASYSRRLPQMENERLIGES